MEQIKKLAKALFYFVYEENMNGIHQFKGLWSGFGTGLRLFNIYLTTNIHFLETGESTMKMN